MVILRGQGAFDVGGQYSPKDSEITGYLLMRRWVLVQSCIYIKEPDAPLHLKPHFSLTQVYHAKFSEQYQCCSLSYCCCTNTGPDGNLWSDGGTVSFMGGVGSFGQGPTNIILDQNFSVFPQGMALLPVI